MLTAVDGGAALSAEQTDRDWRAAWELIADACEQALTGLHPFHPRRDELLTATGYARQAAGRPTAPRLGAA